MKIRNVGVDGANVGVHRTCSSSFFPISILKSNADLLYVGPTSFCLTGLCLKVLSAQIHFSFSLMGLDIGLQKFGDSDLRLRINSQAKDKLRSCHHGMDFLVRNPKSLFENLEFLEESFS